MKKILIVFGTRPEAIKMAPVVGVLKHSKYFRPVVAVTAQHREMLDQVLELFGIVPDYDLDIMRPRQTLFEVTVRALQGLEKVLQEAGPDLVLVHGDTTTTFVGALSAFYFQIPVGHVEAGLRTGNKYAPFPEEMNRRLTAALADLHFAPTARAAEALKREGIDPEKIFVTGNTVIDALQAVVREDYQFTDGRLYRFLEEGKRVILVTTHRRENWGEPLRQVYRALRRVVEQFEDVAVVFPVHRNPVVREAAEEIFAGLNRVHLLEPLPYADFANLMARSYLVLTDSGGLQEEAPSLGKPVLVLREVTERPEALEAGTVRLVGTAEERVFGEVVRLLTDEAAYYRMASAVNPYGDGQASRRILEALLYHFGQGPRPEPFSPKVLASTSFCAPAQNSSGGEEE
ncbi:UDP-N-acetylglucosamine 2-epimerase [Ammonifex degensii KC4]|uniref:UDP-N-acetylglucosamine 2-epimerase (non-hydrolyzing) n=1 Tax=Ammonifex degensii (strain DSM 10501 / KC4) TaxID=429009 RepID=C9RAE1_AMMDK|nr:UDP-N-acetylglucosamine 2-epimerase (non-hydrolyzing) [Ammonifex degensii]ACX51250.1 UDP-N-acetylglucosamine 2-epimerase [Ammonifex degensii KC4]